MYLLVLPKDNSTQFFRSKWKETALPIFGKFMF